MTSYLDYTAYFEKIAIDLLEHSSAEKHFFRKGLEEFLNGLSTSVNYPALLLEKYDFSFTDNGADNVMKERTIAFTVCDHAADIEDYDRIDEIMSFTEGVVDKIYNRMRKDMSPPQHEFLKNASLGSMRVTPVENKADGNYGFFVSIGISTYHNQFTL